MGRSFLRKWLPGGFRLPWRPRKCPSGRFRPGLEALEDRLVPANYVVNATTDTGAGSGFTGDLRYCITQANASAVNDIITFSIPNGSTITLNSALPVIASATTAGTLTITGLGSANLTISGNNRFTVIDNGANAASTISGVTLTQGTGYYRHGGGITNYSSLTLSDVKVTNCVGAGYNIGAGILNNASGVITGTSVTISGNSITAGGSGAGLFNRGTSVTLTSSSITGNTSAGGSGVGVYNQSGSTFTATNTTISSNRDTAGGGNGGGLSNQGTAVLTGCTISSNYATGSGGGIFSQNGSVLTMSGGSVSTNSTSHANYRAGGGFFLNGGSSSTLSGITISGNSSGDSGGGIESRGALYLSNSTISSNSLSQFNRGMVGGGIHISAGNITITGCNIEKNSITKTGSNTSYSRGAGISDDSGNLTITNCTILGNTIVTTNNNRYGADNGAGLASSASTTITNSTISGNSITNSGLAPMRGAGITSSNILNLTNVGIGVQIADPLGGTPFAGNKLNCPLSTYYSSGGGGIWFSGGASIWNSVTIQNNVVGDGSTSSNSQHDGGGVRTASSSPLTINNSTISGNTAGSRGGGIFSSSLLTINNSTISGNISGGTTNLASAYNAMGGGIWTNAFLYLNNSTVAQNKTNSSGYDPSGRFTGGSAIAFFGNISKLVNCTISGNSTAVGKGALLHGYSPNVILINTIVAGNTALANPDVFTQSGNFNAVASFNNLIGNVGNSNFVNGVNANQVGTAASPINPMLGPLQNNGGLTATMGLLATSPAIDKGRNSSSPGSTDQRGPGFNRIINSIIDIGAFEYQPPATVTTINTSLNPATAGQSVTFTATVTATATGSNVPQGTVTFLDNGTPIGTVTLVNGVAALSTSSLTVGTHTITAQYNGFVLGSYQFAASSANLSETITPPPPPPPPPPPVFPTALFATGADAGGQAVVNVYNSFSGNLISVLLPFGPTFTGGVRVAVGDINGDGVPDIICAAGPGAGPQVTVYDGQTSAILLSFYAFSNSLVTSSGTATAGLSTPIFAFTGGMYVAAGDVFGQGYEDIIVGADKGGGPQVEVFDGKTGALVSSFFAFAPNFTGGVRVAAADLFGTGRAEIVCSAGPGGGPQVSVWDGTGQTQFASFFAFAPGFKGGVYIGAGDLFGTGRANIIAGADKGGGPQVTIFDGPTQTLLSSFYAFPSNFTGGVRVSTDGLIGGKQALLVGAGPTGGPQVEIFDGATLALLGSFFAYSPSFTGGIFVGGA